MEASIKDSKISGTDRAVAWDGATMGGQDLQNQVIHPGLLHFPFTCEERVNDLLLGVEPGQ